MISLDRFAYGRPDPQDKPAAQVGHCVHCQSAIMQGDEVIELDGDMYCDSVCLMRKLGARYVGAGMEG
jgi:hypothetical protein